MIDEGWIFFSPYSSSIYDWDKMDYDKAHWQMHTYYCTWKA